MCLENIYEELKLIIFVVFLFFRALKNKNILFPIFIKDFFILIEKHVIL